MANEKLQVTKTILDALQYALKNIASLLGVIVLYMLTVWIPYLNVGTTIGLYKAIIAMGRGEVVNPVDIFDKSNWKNLGDFFLLLGLISIGITAAACFAFIPGIILGIAWDFAIYLYIDKGLGATKALKVSYAVTDGEKKTIFLVEVLAVLALFVLIGIFAGLAAVVPEWISWFFYLLMTVTYLLWFTFIFAVQGVMYAHFSAKADELLANGGCSCGCGPNCNCGPECDCGCNEGKECTCGCNEPATPAEPAAPAEPEAPKAE